MTKKYLKAGCRLQLNAAIIRIGASGTVVDAQIDWDGTVACCCNEPDSPVTMNNGIGTVTDDEQWTYDVFLDVKTGKLWFDNERPY